MAQLKVLSNALEKMRGALDVPMSIPCFTMKVNSPSCLCKKKKHWAIQMSPSNICSLASSIAHICEQIQMGLSNRGQVPSHASLCEHCSLSPSSAKEAVPVWREVFIPPSGTISLTIAAKRLFHQRHKTYMMRVPSIAFCPLRLSIRVPFEQCALHGVCSARCACTGTETNYCFARVYFFAVFVISSTPMTSSRLGPTDRYDDDAQMRKSSAGALHRGAALRLFPFASFFAVLNRIVFALDTTFMSNGSKGGKSAWNSRSVSPMSTT